MLFRVLVASVVILQFAGIPLDPDLHPHPNHSNASTFLYFPYVAYEMPLQVVIISAAIPSDRSEFTVSGYVLNRTREPYYDVSVQVTLSVSTTGTTTETLGGLAKTAFPATLPGQPNPFIYIERRAYFNSAVVEPIEIATARAQLPGDPVYMALDNFSWANGSSRITGFVINDTATTLRNVTGLVGFLSPGSCTTRGLFMTTILRPNETLFFDTYSCPPARPYFVAQGELEP